MYTRIVIIAKLILDGSTAHYPAYERTASKIHSFSKPLSHFFMFLKEVYAFICSKILYSTI